MSLKEQLAAEGIKLGKSVLGHHEVDCPKEFCAKARAGTDNHTCLKVDVISRTYAKWKCSHCLWTGQAGTPEKEPEGQPTIPVEAPVQVQQKLDHKQPIVFAESESDLQLLIKAGVQNVVHVPNSAAFQRIADSIMQSTVCILAFNNTDEGDRLRHEVARRVGVAKCYNVTYGEGTLAKTLEVKGADWVCDDIQLAKPYPITGLYHVTDFEQSLIKYFEGGMASGVSTGYSNVDNYYTVMPGELTVVTGEPNNGKSEWVDALTLNIALAEGWGFGVFSPENGKEQHVIKLAEKRVEMSANPKSPDRMSLDTFLSGSAWVAQHYFFVVGDDEDNLPTLDWILLRLADAVLRYGIKGAIIDPWNEVEHQRPATMSETEYVSQALSKLKRFARNHDIHIWVIAHPNKRKTEKDGKTSAPSLYDISGSAHWANKADNGIVIHRSDDIADATEVWIKKVRFKHVGKRGMTTLKYNPATGRFSIPEGTDGAIYSQAGDDIQTYEGHHGQTYY